MKSNRHIGSMEERKKIAALYQQDLSVTEIANRLNLTDWQIRYELKRGYTGKMDDLGRPIYDPVVAQRNYNSKIFRGNLYQPGQTDNL